MNPSGATGMMPIEDRGSGSWSFVLPLALGFSLLATAGGCVREGAVWYLEPPELRQAQRDVQRSMDRIDNAVQAASLTLAEVGLTGPEAQDALDYLVTLHPAVASSHATDATGHVVAIAPLTYQATVGIDFGDTPDVRRVVKESTPAMSPVIRSPHGPYAVAVRWPILDEDGACVGSVGVMLRYAALLEHVLQPIYAVSAYDAFVLQLDGLVLFDRDPNERGRNIFEDDLYRTFPEFIDLVRGMIAAPEGRGNARFLSTGHHSIRPQSFVWTTVSLHDTAWRVILSRDG